MKNLDMMIEDPLVIDIHTHILPTKFPKFSKKFGYGSYLNVEPRIDSNFNLRWGKRHFKVISPNLFDAPTRIKEEIERGIHFEVLSTIPQAFCYWAKPEDGAEISRFMNDNISDYVNEFPERFIGLGTLPMQDAELALEELDRVIKDLELSGVIIGTHIDKKSLNHPDFLQVFERIEQLGIAVFIHPINSPFEETQNKGVIEHIIGVPEEVTRAILSITLGGILDKFPKLRIAFSHGGGSISLIIDWIDHVVRGRPDLQHLIGTENPRKYIGRFWVDSLAISQRNLEFLIGAFGEDKVCLGTDYPFPSGDVDAGSIIDNSSYPDHVKWKLLGKNAMEWLNLSPSKIP